MQIPSIKGPNEQIIITLRSPKGKGSLNFNTSKNEAQRIDLDNLQ
jgi:hypothetical protein